MTPLAASASVAQHLPSRWLSPVEQLVVDVLGLLHVGAHAVHDLNQLLQLLLQTLEDQAVKEASMSLPVKKSTLTPSSGLYRAIKPSYHSALPFCRNGDKIMERQRT